MTSELQRSGEGFSARLFLAADGRVRAIWRAVLFVVLLGVVLVATAVAMLFVLRTISPVAAELAEQGLGGVLSMAGALAVTPLYVVWVAVTLLLSGLLLRVLDRASFRALGLWLYRGWLRELLLGIVLGAGLIGGITALLVAGGWVRYAGLATEPGAALGSVAAVGVLLFFAAAWEELVFRGYPFQRLVESLGPLGAVLVLSALFGAGHIANPSSTPLSTADTVLAGVLLAVAYLKTRALWLPIGLHWAWNFFMGPVLGLPVSGIRMGEPLLRTEAAGPAWLSGGAYGPEGSVVTTAVVALATVWLWRTRRISPSTAAPQGLQ